MTVTVKPAALEGRLQAIASKSQAHRLLICAALSDRETRISCRGSSRDILATAGCLEALGAKIRKEKDAFRITPIPRGNTQTAILDCGESGSTYRLLTPLVCGFNRTAEFCLSGKLPERPMESLWLALEAHGARIERKGTDSPSVAGPISPGRYEIDGGVSSQFISGLLFTLPRLPGDSELIIGGKAVSGGYIRMTLDALKEFSVKAEPTLVGYHIPGRQKFLSSGEIAVEGDWSNAAFWMCAAAARGEGISLTGIHAESLQGDRAVCEILRQFGAKVELSGDAVTVWPGDLHGICVDVGEIPDLVPALAVAAAGAQGETVFKNAGRLRWKESNRLRTVCNTINSLGGMAAYTEDEIHILGQGSLSGGTADSCQDHRIAMMAAAASVLCVKPVSITNAETVEKSYPAFFEDMASLGGCLTKEER